MWTKGTVRYGTTFFQFIGESHFLESFQREVFSKIPSYVLYRSGICCTIKPHRGSVETTPASLIEWEDPCHRRRNEERHVERPLIYGPTHTLISEFVYSSALLSLLGSIVSYDASDFYQRGFTFTLLWQSKSKQQTKLKRPFFLKKKIIIPCNFL